MINAMTKLATDLKRLAYERTLMARIRTVVSLITFGFSIHDLFSARTSRCQARSSHPSEGVPIIIIVIGLLSCLMATLEKPARYEALKAEYLGDPIIAVACVCGINLVSGILTLVTVILAPVASESTKANFRIAPE